MPSASRLPAVIILLLLQIANHDLARLAAMSKMKASTADAPRVIARPAPRLDGQKGRNGHDDEKAKTEEVFITSISQRNSYLPLFRSRRAIVALVHTHR